MDRMIKGFKDFLLRGNVVDLAVAVVIGTAFTALVTAFIDVVPRAADRPDRWRRRDRAASVMVNGQRFTWGAFLSAVITFVLTAAVVYFVVVLPMKRLIERRRRGEEAGPGGADPGRAAARDPRPAARPAGQRPGRDPSGPGTTTLPGQV